MSKPLPSAPCQHPQASVHEFLRRILDSARPPIALYPAPSTRYKDMGTKTISRPPPTAHSMSADAMAIPDTSHLRPPVPPPLPASRRRNADNVTNKITPTLPPPPPPPTARQRIANPFSNR
ncbi:hypothetical protein D9619_007958 [Psilocybe cf. subviscida]|uniref:Uncharacterized protein n=1 Tax=Psilocybe cf. subviscida TaxID=2480587 RepID=A0A8H5ESE7_9AGAR|nr:hypothetical protein D9619_007958 [Psilocybe cf. subviscida]